MVNLPFGPAVITWKSGVISPFSTAIILFFKGLYLMKRRGYINALPGIALALSDNRELIGRRGKAKFQAMKGKNEAEGFI